MRAIFPELSRLRAEVMRSLKPCLLLIASVTFCAITGERSTPFSRILAVIENGANESLAWPSVTLIVTPEYLPACDADGVPLSVPVPASKLAQSGIACTWNDSFWPSGSEADGLNT